MTDQQFENLDIELTTPSLDDGDFVNQKEKRKKIVIAIVSILLVVVLAVSCALLVKTYVITSFIVNGISMYPTLDGGNGKFGDSIDTNGEVLYLNKLAKINRGDIVVINPPWDSLKRYDNEKGEYYINLVKRVIGVGGDTIEIRDGKVYLNGSILDEPYLFEQMNDAYDNHAPWIIEEGYIFCMGDNRNNSSDCRAFGQVSLEDVVGKCFLVKGIDGKLRTPK